MLNIFLRTSYLWIHKNLYDNSVTKSAYFVDNNYGNGPQATLITVKDTFSHVFHHVFYQLALGFMELFSTATFEPFWPLHGHCTATHGYEFSTANNFFKLPHLRKVAVMTATWQHCKAKMFQRRGGWE
jgi:hypothetical protein